MTVDEQIREYQRQLDVAKAAIASANAFEQKALAEIAERRARLVPEGAHASVVPPSVP
jgi:hypothetical protein